MPRTFKNKRIDPKGHPLPDNYREVSRLRDKANSAARKARNRRRVTRAATKIFGGFE